MQYHEERGQPADDMLQQVLQADVQAFHYNYEIQHGADEEMARMKAASVASDCSHSAAAKPVGPTSYNEQVPVNPRQLQEALMATAEFRARGAAPAPSDANFTTATFGPMQIDSSLTDDERFSQLCEQMQRLPQLEENQQYMVVPETSDGQQGPAVFLDPAQLAHLQAIAAQQQESQGQEYFPYLQDPYQPIYYLPPDGEAAQQPARGFVPATAAAAAAPIAQNNLVSSPSIDEEIARLQIADSDSDEPSPSGDIGAAAAAAAATTTNASQDQNK